MERMKPSYTVSGTVSCYSQYGEQYACMLIHFSHIQLFVTPRAIAHQASLSKGFSRQEYWNGLPFPSSGGFPDPGIEPWSPAL